MSADDQRRLLGVALIDAQTIVAVGDGALMRSDDAGVSWTDYELAELQPRTLDAVAFADASHGIAVGWTYFVSGQQTTSPHPVSMITSDGGMTWTEPTFPWEDYSFSLRTICMTALGTALTGGFAYSGGLAALSHDFGATWQPVAADPEHFVAPIGATCLESGDLWGVGGPALIHSPDNGQTWAFPSLPDDSLLLVDISFIDATRGFVTGGDAILSTVDGGDSWTRESHPYAGEVSTNLDTITAAGSTVLVGGWRATAAGRVGVILVRVLTHEGRDHDWIEADLPPGTETISDVALTPPS